MVLAIFHRLLPPPNIFSSHQILPHSQTLLGITIGRATNSNATIFYKPVTQSIYTTGECALKPECHTNTHFGLTYDGGIFFGIYSSYSEPSPGTYPPGTKIIYCPTDFYPVQGTAYYKPPPYKTPVTPEEDPTYSIKLQNGDLVGITT